MKLRGRGERPAIFDNAASRRIGDLLVEAGAATKDQVKGALKQQRHNHRPLGEILVGLGVRSDVVTQALTAGTSREHLEQALALLDQARAEYEYFLAARPSLPDSHYDIGTVKMRMG